MKTNETKRQTKTNQIYSQCLIFSCDALIILEHKVSKQINRPIKNLNITKYIHQSIYIQAV